MFQLISRNHVQHIDHIPLTLALDNINPGTYILRTSAKQTSNKQTHQTTCTTVRGLELKTC